MPSGATPFCVDLSLFFSAPGRTAVFSALFLFALIHTDFELLAFFRSIPFPEPRFSPLPESAVLSFFPQTGPETFPPNFLFL